MARVLVHGFGLKIRIDASAVHRFLSSVQRLVQTDAAFGPLHPSGPVH